MKEVCDADEDAAYPTWKGNAEIKRNRINPREGSTTMFGFCFTRLSSTPFCGGGRQKRANAKPDSPVRATTTEMHVKFIMQKIALKGRTGGKLNS